MRRRMQALLNGMSAFGTRADLLCSTRVIPLLTLSRSGSSRPGSLTYFALASPQSSV